MILLAALAIRKKRLNEGRVAWLVWVSFALALFVSLFISLFPIKDGGYATQRFLLCAFSILFFGAGILKYIMAEKVSLISVQDLIGLIFCTLPFVITPLFYTGVFKWTEPAMFAFFFSAVILGSQYCGKRESVITLVKGMSVVVIVLALFYGGMAINYYIFSMIDGEFNVDNLIPWGFINMRYWSHMSTWLLPLFPLALISVPFKAFSSWRLLVYIAASLWVWLIIMSTARGSFLGLLLGTFVAVLLFGKSAWLWLRTYCCLWFAGGLAWLFFSIVLPSIIFGQLEIRNVSSGDSGRIPLWSEALLMSLERFPWGMGPQSWLTHDILTSTYQDSRKYGHPHNMYLLWAAEYGWGSVFGVAVLVAIGAQRLFLISKSLRDGRKREDKSVLVALTVSVVAALLHAGVSAVFMAPASMLVGLFILMVFWAQVRHELPPGTSFLISRCSRIVSTLALLIVMALGGFWLREVQLYHGAMLKDQKYYYDHIPLGLMPRFWHHGNFPRAPEAMP